MPGPLGRLSVQIALGPVLVIALVGAAVLWRVDADLQTQAEARFADRITRASAQLDDRLKNDAELRIVNARLLASQPAFVAALEKNDPSEITQIATTFMARSRLPHSGASGIRVYTPAGTLMLRAEAPGNLGQRTPPADVLAALKSGTPEGQVRLDETLGLAVSGIAPVTSNGRVLGAVESISALDRTFARDAAALVNSDVAVIAGGRLAANSDEDMSFDPARLSASTRANATAEPTHLRIGAEDFLSQFVAYQDDAGNAIGEVFVGIEHQRIQATIDETRGSIVRTVLVATMLAAVAAWLFGWYTMRRMQPLVEAASRLRQNDLESPVPSGGPAELRQIGDAMEEMRVAVRQSRDALQSANRDLADRVFTSDASLSEVTQDLDVMQAVVSQLAGESAGGLAGVTEELVRLEWVDSAFIALATETGELSTAATAGMLPEAAAAVLNYVHAHLMENSDVPFVIEDALADVEANRLAAWFIGGLAVIPMSTPDGIAGILCVTSSGYLSLTPQRREVLRAISREVTGTLERSELADEVEENRRVAEAVLREMADGVIVVDSHNVCQICNPAAARLLGLSRAQIIGRHADEWMPVADSTFDALRQRTLDGTRPASTPLLIETAGVKIAITAGPFADPNPARSGVILLLRDLSAEAEAERVKRDFVSMVGHELRTPLTLIRTTIDMLHGHDAGELNSTQQRIVEVLMQNSDRLMSLISDLLDMSALDSGRMQIAPSSNDLVEIVNVATRSARSAALEHDHALSVVAPGEPVQVWADAARIGQVLANLLSNAIKYTPPGGEIEVRVEGTAPFASVSVTDTGIGIQPEEQGGLFEKFYRTSSGRRTTGGTGLGLAIARSIVDLHGGTIRCESDGQTGTTFTFTLPRRPL